MKAGLVVKAYRFRGRNFNRAKRGDFNSRGKLVFEVEFLVEGLINSAFESWREKIFEGRRTLHLLQ